MKLLERLKINLIVDSRDRYKEAILSLVEREDNVRLLDLGSGDYRRLTAKVVDAIGTCDVTCVDLDELRPGMKTVESYVHYKNNLNEPLPFEDESFDVAIASQIIEHLHSTDGFVKEIYRVLKPSSYAIISTPNLASWHNALYLLLGKQPDAATVSDELYPWKEQPGHRRVFVATELIKLLRFHNFVIEKVIGTSYYPLLGPIANWLARRDWKHAGNTTVKVRK